MNRSRFAQPKSAIPSRISPLAGEGRIECKSLLYTMPSTLRDHATQVLRVLRLAHTVGLRQKLFFIDVAQFIGDLFQAGHFQPCAVLQDSHEVTRLQKGVMRSRIEPGETAP